MGTYGKGLVSMMRTLVVIAACVCPVGLLHAQSTTGADPATQSYFAANGLLNRGLFELAVPEYESFLRDHPNHEKAALARYGLAVCLFRTGKFDKALAPLTALAKVADFSLSAEVGVMRGQSLMSLARYADAADSFASVVQRDDTHDLADDLADDAAAGWVEASYQAGKTEQAVEQCGVFIRQWPKSPLRSRVEFFGALAHVQREQFSKAAKLLDAMLKRDAKGPPAEGGFKAAVPLADRALLLLARCQQRSGKPVRAIDAYKKLLNHAASPLVPDALLGAAVVFREQGEAAAAAELLDRFIDDYSGSVLVQRARFERALARFDLGEFDRAAKAFGDVAQQEGDLRGDAVYWQARCMSRLGKPSVAAAVLAKHGDAFEHSRLAPRMLYDRGVALMQAEDLDAASEAFKEFAERYAEHELAAEALYLRASVAHRQSAFSDSLQLCDEFLRTHKSHQRAETVSFMAAENEFLAGHHERAAERYEQFLASFPKSDQSLKAAYRLGSAMYALDRPEQAERVLSEVIDRAPDDPIFRSAYLSLGDIYFSRGEWQRVETAMTAYLAGQTPAMEDERGVADALLKLGLCHQRREQHEQALRAYRQLRDMLDAGNGASDARNRGSDDRDGGFDAQPYREQAMFESAQTLVALDRDDEAVALFSELVASNAEGRFAPYALDHLGTIALARGEFPQAADYFARVAKGGGDGELRAGALARRGEALLAARQFEKAEKVLSSFIKRFPKHAATPAALGRRTIALARGGHCDAALSLMDQWERGGATGGKSTFGGVEVGLRAAVRYEIAWCQSAGDRGDDAAKTYRELIDGDAPTALRERAMLELAGLAEKDGDYDEAATLLRKLRSLTAGHANDPANDTPDDVAEQGLYRLAVCEYQLNRHSPAAKTFKAFIDRFPKSAMLASAHFFCAEALSKLGKHKRAATHFGEIVERHASDALAEPALLRLGESHASLQQWSLSEQAFARFLDQYPGSEQSYQAQFAVGWAREHQSRHEQAIDAYRRVVEKHTGPTAARAQFQIGECLFAQRHFDEAVRALLKVDILYDYPEWSAAALYEAGRCFGELGRRVEARRQFESVVERHADTDWAKMASRELAKKTGVTIPGRGTH